MLNYRSLLIIILLLLSGVATAQEVYYTTQHRPAGMNWQELNTPHFRVIFPAGYDSVAYLTARILEDQYPVTKALTGGELTRFPVVITDYNDDTNGFVTSLNFRSEFDLAPFKGKTINPASGSWLEAVLPHELLHANHANFNNKGSIGHYIRFLSPDMARSINFFPPSGVHEGLAVYHETENISEHGGRGHYGYFNNQFDAGMTAPKPWSMGQTLIPSDYTLPSDRHYIAGYGFTDWLQDTYGEDITKEAISTHYNYFFLGWGFALQQATGKWPGELYEAYKQEVQKEAGQHIPDEHTRTDPRQTLIESGFSGVRQRGPVWISDDLIVFYSYQYNAPRGLYALNPATNSIKKLSEEYLVGDYRFSVDASAQHLYFAAFTSRGRYFDPVLSELKALHLETGSVQTVSDHKRIYAPEAISKEEILAIQADHGKAQIVRILADDRLDTLKQFSDATPVQIESHPHDPDQLAVVMNHRGVQALWFTSVDDLPRVLDGAPDIAFKEGSIFDVRWHPSGDRILFTLISEHAMNVYEYELNSGRLYQQTESEFGAFEGAYSPDGEQIVYVSQRQDQQQILAILNRSDLLRKPVPDKVLLTGAALDEALRRPYLGDELRSGQRSWSRDEYHTDWSWLKPRLVYPVSINRANDVYEYGAVITSTDVLESQSYSVQLTGLEDRLWYDLNYTNKTFWPGFSVTGYSTPSYQYLPLSEAVDRGTYLAQERGFRFSIPVTYTFRDLSRSNAASFTPYVKLEQQRYMDLDSEPLSDFIDQNSAGLSTQLNYRVLMLPRDVQPSAGIQLLAVAEKTLSGSDEILTMPSGNQYRLELQDQHALYYGANVYTSPLRRFNQSLKIEARVLQQSEVPIFSTNTITPLGYGDNPFAGAKNIGRLSTRYAIPLTYPDNGGLLVPFYVRSVYLSLFSHTMADMSSGFSSTDTRSIFGAGIHFQFNISNLNFEVGIGVAYEPARNNTEMIIGEF